MTRASVAPHRSHRRRCSHRPGATWSNAPQAWSVLASSLPHESQVRKLVHRPSRRDHSPECPPTLHLAFARTLITSPTMRAITAGGIGRDRGTVTVVLRGIVRTATDARARGASAGARGAERARSRI